MEKQKYDYKTIDLGCSQECPVKMQTVEVTVNLDSVAHDYAEALVEEGYRINYDKAKYVQLQVDEVFNYLRYLLAKRIECVNGRCSDFRQLKVLWIPSYFQYVLSTIGLAIDRDEGLKFKPILSEDWLDSQERKDFGYAEAVVVSDKIASFCTELQMVQDAMPRDIHGDLNIMATALVNNYVHACKHIEHPAATYVTVFLDMKLQEELTYSILYRRRYGDADLIRTILTKDRRLY